MATIAARHRNYAPPGAAHGRALETPYMRAKREWDSRMGSAVVQARSWRVNSMVLASLLGGSLLANVYLGIQPKAIPHVIEVDSLGRATYRGPVGSEEFTPDEGLIRYHLRRFVETTRTVSSDPMVMRKYWFDAYAMLTPRANSLMGEWIKENNPFERQQEETVAVNILSAVPLSKESWQIDWKETRWDKRGIDREKPVVWRAILRIVLEPPRTTEQMTKNPLGLYVDEFHWDRIKELKP